MKYFVFVFLFFYIPFTTYAQVSDTAPAEAFPTAIAENTDDRLAPEDIPENEYIRAKVITIPDAGTREVYGNQEVYQVLEVELTSGSDVGEIVTIENSSFEGIDLKRQFVIGDRIVVVKIPSIEGGYNYFLADSFRLGALGWIFGLFVVLVLWFGRKKGIGSLLGLGFSILVLMKYIVPQIAIGKNPLVVTLVGALIIMAVSLYLAHGFNRRTTLALGSTMLTLGVTLVLSTVFVKIAHLYGIGTEEAFFLQSNQFGDINLQGLLLAGILIGTLGVLDDITTAQTAVVGELRYANPNLSKRELYTRALVVGKEHISSLVNTLVLAYAGASLPLFLLFTESMTTPLWYTLNSEFIAEEVVRTLIGSISLVLAVPIATYMAAHFLSKTEAQKIHDHAGHGHSH